MSLERLIEYVRNTERVSAGVTWRTGPQLRLADSDAGSARFQAIQPGRALISATVDGELATTIVDRQLRRVGKDILVFKHS